MTSLPSIGHETGIRIIGYDFSEAQHGKDICDQKIATTKEHVNDELSKPLFGANYPSESEQSGKRVSNITMGWAFKKHESTRFSTAVKAYLNDKFLICEETGNKASPTQVAREMHRE